MSNVYEFYDGSAIEDIDAHYYMIYGERSNGKTTYGLEKILTRWLNEGKQGAYIRRYDEQIKGSKGEDIWSSIVYERGLVEEWTDGKWDRIVYQSRKWYLAKFDEETQTTVKQGQPFCYAFAINQGENYKGTTYPDITTIVFDEFLSRDRYLRDEFVEFTNLLSTIIRQRDDVEIYMLGNTVNPYSTYFEEMGLHDVRNMEQGDIQIYEYNTKTPDGKERTMYVAVEYTETRVSGKKSDIYFAFDNPKLNMITNGSWELPMYPHAPFKIKQKDILEVFFIDFKEYLLQGNIILKEDMLFLFFHRKTTELKDDDKLIYSLDYSPKINHATSLVSGYRNKLSARIGDLISKDLIYYQDNQVGEMIRNYILESENKTATNL